MKWEKKGLIFKPNNNFGWMNSHAQIPAPLLLEDRFRVYFSSRPEKNLSLTSFIDLELDNPSNIIFLNKTPILSLGDRGLFDEHGIMPSCAIHNENEVWLYYGGWSRRESIPYSNWTGLAISQDNGYSFKKYNNTPIFDRAFNEPYSATAVFVRKSENAFDSWYASGQNWIYVDNHLEEYYRIRMATSSDGINWVRQNKELLNYKNQFEPTHRPTVIEYNSKYHMWFCFRKISNFRDGNNSYRIGYAYSFDKINWFRDDELAGIDVSSEGWDSKMIAYPYVLKCKEKLYMFYNGNGFGSSGFGYATLDLKSLK